MEEPKLNSEIKSKILESTVSESKTYNYELIDIGQFFFQIKVKLKQPETFKAFLCFNDEKYKIYNITSKTVDDGIIYYLWDGTPFPRYLCIYNNLNIKLKFPRRTADLYYFIPPIVKII